MNEEEAQIIRLIYDMARKGERCDTFLTEKVRRKTERMVKNTCRTNDPTGGMMG